MSVVKIYILIRIYLITIFSPCSHVFFSVAGLYVLLEWRTKGSEYWRTGCDHKTTLLDGLYIRKKYITTKSQELEKSKRLQKYQCTRVVLAFLN